VSRGQPTRQLHTLHKLRPAASLGWVYSVTVCPASPGGCPGCPLCTRLSAPHHHCVCLGD
jgi:hypothetical protein